MSAGRSSLLAACLLAGLAGPAPAARAQVIGGAGGLGGGLGAGVGLGGGVGAGLTGGVHNPAVGGLPGTYRAQGLYGPAYLGGSPVPSPYPPPPGYASSPGRGGATIDGDSARPAPGRAPAGLVPPPERGPDAMDGANGFRND